MTIALNGATVDTGPLAPGLPAPRAQAALMAALGRPDPAAVARLQLPSAVTAATTLTKLPAQVPPAPKPLQRQPSSAVAAQFIAQDTALGARDLEIFVAPPAPAPANVAASDVDDYLSALRIARGDIPEAKPNKTAPGHRSSLEKIDVAIGEEATRAKTSPQAAESSLRGGFSTLAAGLPGLMLPLLRRMNITTIKGAAAYQFAQARNATLRQTIAEPS